MISLTLRYSIYFGALRIPHITKQPTMMAMTSIAGLDRPAWRWRVFITISPELSLCDHSIRPTRLKLGRLKKLSQCIQTAKALPTISFSGT